MWPLGLHFRDKYKGKMRGHVNTILMPLNSSLEGWFIAMKNAVKRKHLAKKHGIQLIVL